MDFNRIDLQPLESGWGCVWQGGTADAAVASLPGPLLIVCMDRGEVNEPLIDHAGAVQGVLAVWIEDSPDAALADAVLAGLVKAVAAWLASGGNAYVHCAAGVSRASYFDIALHMHVLGLGYDAAFELVHSRRPVAHPNAGFEAQLRRLEGLLAQPAGPVPNRSD